MTYGLSIDNPAGKLVISSDGTGYKYLGNATMSLAASNTSTYSSAIGDYHGQTTPYTFTMTLPGGTNYPIIGVKLSTSTIVNAYPAKIQQSQTTSLTYIIGLGFLARPVDTATGFIYERSYLISAWSFPNSVTATITLISNTNTFYSETQGYRPEANVGSPHGIVVGQQVTIRGSGVSDLNKSGMYVLNSTATTITVLCNNSSSGSSGGSDSGQVVGGPRQQGWNFGLLSVRDNAIYEGEQIFFGLYYHQMVMLSDAQYPGISYQPTTLTVQIDSCNVSGALAINTITMVPPTVCVFCPYVNSDGSSGYGLNLYDSSGTKLTFSSNKKNLWINQTVIFPNRTDYINYGYNNNINYSNIAGNGDQVVATTTLSSPVVLIGQGNGYAWVKLVADTSGGYETYQSDGPFLDYQFGWSYSGSTIVRKPYIIARWNTGTYNGTYLDGTLNETKLVVLDGTLLNGLDY